MTTVEIGTSIPPVHVDGVDACRMKTMAALLRDPNPIHFDPRVVRALGLGDRPVNQGPTNVGYIVTALLAWVGEDPTAVRRLQVRFAGNVFAGDRVTAGGTVVALDDADGATIATCEVWLDRDDGTRLVQGQAEVAVPTQETA